MAASKGDERHSIFGFERADSTGLAKIHRSVSALECIQPGGASNLREGRIDGLEMRKS